MAKLKKRKDGRFQRSVYVGTVDGKNKYILVCGRTEREVNQKAEALKLRIGRGMDVLNENMKFSELVEKWLIYKKPQLKESQYKSYITNLKPFDPLNTSKINKLIQNDFQTIINDWAQRNPHTGKPTAKGTLRAYRLTASQVFEFAIENRILDYNPLRYVKIPKSSPRAQRRALTEQEQSWIINTPHRAQLPAMLMMLAGLRKSECLALQWQDINLEEKTIFVHQKLDMKSTPPHIEQGTKSKSGIRTVYIPDLLVRFLKNQQHESPTDYVCTTAHGRLFTVTAWKELWDSYLTDLNLAYGDFSKYEKEYKSKFDPSGVPFVIERFTAHFLRHTFATNLLFCGRDLLYVQNQLGHAKPETTLNIYTHLVKNNLMNPGNKVININSYLKQIEKKAT